MLVTAAAPPPHIQHSTAFNGFSPPPLLLPPLAGSSPLFVLLQGYHTRSIYSIDWCPASNLIATGCGDNHVRVFKPVRNLRTNLFEMAGRSLLALFHPPPYLPFPFSATALLLSCSHLTRSCHTAALLLPAFRNLPATAV